jgi:hypothetical protein
MGHGRQGNARNQDCANGVESSGGADGFDFLDGMGAELHREWRAQRLWGIVVARLCGLVQQLRRHSRRQHQ